MDDLSVDWSTAEVTPYRDRLRLRVELNDDPSYFWHNAFVELRDKTPGQGLQAGQDWWVDSPSNRFLSVGGIREADDIDAIRRHLDEAVSAANERAKKAHAEWNEKKRAEKERAEKEADARLKAAAEELQERFRGDPTG